MLGVLGSKTGRNQPSNAKFIFDPSAWIRSLIKPEPGMGLAYVDFSSQEVGRLQEIMTEADRIVLDGFPVRNYAYIVRAPGRYMDKRGTEMWRMITSLLNKHDHKG